MLALKGNQPQLESEFRGYFEAAREDDFERPEIAREETANEGHGRTEHRSYFLSTDLSAVSGVGKWSGLKAVGMVESQRRCGGRVSIEQRYFISSVDDIESFHQAVRSHWSIENELHWRLDVTFREDASRIRRGNAPHNLGVIRHVAMNLLKREPSKISVRKKRIRAALNDDFRHNILMTLWFYMRLPCLLSLMAERTARIAEVICRDSKYDNSTNEVRSLQRSGKFKPTQVRTTISVRVRVPLQ